MIGTAIAAACACLLPVVPAASATPEEAGVVADINAIRVGRGLRPLELHPELERKAEDWAVHLAAIGTLVHSSFTDGITVKWSALAENVVAEQSIAKAEQKVVSSPVHYANIVDPDLTHIGVGIAAAGEGIYLVQEFMQLQASPAPTAESTATAPTTAVTSAAPAATAAPTVTPAAPAVTPVSVSAGGPAPLPTPAPAQPNSAELSGGSAPTPPPAAPPAVPTPPRPPALPAPAPIAPDQVQAVSSTAIAPSQGPPVTPAAHIVADGSEPAGAAVRRGAWILAGLVAAATAKPHRRSPTT